MEELTPEERAVLKIVLPDLIKQQEHVVGDDSEHPRKKVVSVLEGISAKI